MGREVIPVSASGHGLVQDDQHLASLGLISLWDILQKFFASFWCYCTVIYAFIQKANEGQRSTINLCLLSFFIKYL